MVCNEKIDEINKVLKKYFEVNKVKVRALDLMPQFVEDGVFNKDYARNGLPIRNVLRELHSNNQLDLIPYAIAEQKRKNISWYFAPLNCNESKNIIKDYEKENIDEFIAKQIKNLQPASNSRKESDEYYVIDLCDKVLESTASRQHKFPFLKGDTGRLLPVDAYYKELNLVVEYHESQHTVSTPFFDNKKTVSGVSRGEQRKIYDQRRVEMLAKNNIKLVVIQYTDFGETKKIKRNLEKDFQIVKRVLDSKLAD